MEEMNEPKAKGSGDESDDDGKESRVERTTKDAPSGPRLKAVEERIRHEERQDAVRNFFKKYDRYKILDEFFNMFFVG